MKAKRAIRRLRILGLGANGERPFMPFLTHTYYFFCECMYMAWLYFVSCIINMPCEFVFVFTFTFTFIFESPLPAVLPYVLYVSLWRCILARVEGGWLLCYNRIFIYCHLLLFSTPSLALAIARTQAPGSPLCISNATKRQILRRPPARTSANETKTPNPAPGH